MQSKIIIALRRRYHCEHTRQILAQNALSYPVYELDEQDSSLKVLRRAIEQGAEILITGDVYVDSIMNELDISVVTIRRTKISFSDSIREALRLYDRAAIVWRESDSAVVKKACKDFPGLVSFFPYQSSADFPAIFDELSRQGFRVVIGVGTINESAAKYHMSVVNVPYDESDILSAVHMAKHNLRTLEERQEQAKILNTIQDNISEGILLLDADGHFQTINRSAASFLGLDPRTAKKSTVEQTPLFCPEIKELLSNAAPFSGKTLSVYGSNYALEGTPIFVRDVFRSAILTMTPVERLQNIEQQVRRQLLPRDGRPQVSFQNIIGKSPALTSAIHTAGQYARVDSPVLIYGQSGTGKEMFVQSIHNASRRRNGPFVVINCAALPENIIESELFGYEKGAFTGALSSGKQGLFLQGHQGTVFLDEVSEMPLHVQARFLRVLQEHEVTPVGGFKVIPVDIRVIAASNRDLKEMVRQKKFREDLYYRISVLTMSLPPLSEREGDIELLIRHFIREKRTELKLEVCDVEAAAIQYLRALPWPGNIRQLSNVIERAMVLCPGTVLDLDTARKAVSLSETSFSFDDSGESADSAQLQNGLDDLQKEIIQAALERNGYSRKKTADELGISASTLYRRMKQFGLFFPA